MVKNLPTVWEAGVQSLSQADPLEKGMEIHSSILIWIIPWPEEPGRLQSMGLQRVGHVSVANTLNILLHICPISSLSTRRWTFRLLLCPDYCK